MNGRAGGSTGRSPKGWLRRLGLLLVVASLGAVVGRLFAPRLSPWRHVQEVSSVVLVETGCQFSEAAAACLARAGREDGAEHVIPVATSDDGDLHRRSCRIAADAVSRRGSALARGVLWMLPKDLWCRVLSKHAAVWLIRVHGQLEWPAFVRNGELVGVGLEPGNFRAVGEDTVADELDTCVDDYLRGLRAEEARVPASGTPSPDG